MKEITKLGGEIVIATDNDEMGNKMAKTLVEVAPENSKDWNSAVEKERQRILSLQKQQQRSRGLEL